MRELLLVFIASLLGVLLTVFWYMEIPVVDMSYPSNECVRVHSTDPRYTCDNLPRKYIMRRVKQ